MVNIMQIQKGLSKYIENELLSKMTGWQKWTFGAMAGVALAKTPHVFNQLKEHPVIKMLDVINESGEVDIETIYSEFLKQSDKGSISFQVPMIGMMTLNRQDVEKLYMYITQEG